jgi:hypothetical protein
MTARKKKTMRELVEINFPHYEKIEDVPEIMVGNFLYAHVMSTILREELEK